MAEGRPKQGADAGRRGESIGGQQGFQGPSVKAGTPVGDNRSPHPIVRAKGRRRRDVDEGSESVLHQAFLGG